MKTYEQVAKNALADLFIASFYIKVNKIIKCTEQTECTKAHKSNMIDAPV